MINDFSKAYVVFRKCSIMSILIYHVLFKNKIIKLYIIVNHHSAGLPKAITILSQQ